MFVNCSQNGQLGLYQNQCTFQKIHSLSTGGAHSRLLAHIASPTSPPLCRYTTHSSVPHTATVEMPFLRHCSTNGKLRVLVKAQPAPQAPGHCHQLGLAYGPRPWSIQRIHSRPLWLFCCFQTQTCFHKQPSLTTHSY